MTEIRKTRRSVKPVMIPIGLPDLDKEFEETKYSAEAIRAIFGYAARQLVRIRHEQAYVHKGMKVAKPDVPAVALNSNVIRKLVGRDSAKYMRMLSEREWLNPIKKEGNQRGSYWPGEKYISYRFGSDILKKRGADKRKFRREYISDEWVLEKLEEVRVAANTALNKRRTVVSSSDNVVRKIWEYSDMVRLDTNTIQLDEQNKIIGKQAGLELSVIADDINGGEYRTYKHDEFGHRILNVATNLPKKARKYMHFVGYESIPLVTLDICNSQPYLLSLILMDVELCLRFIPEFEPLLKIIKRLRVRDKSLFHKHCAEGKVYEHWLLMRGEIESIEIVAKEKREKVKDAFMSFLFSAPGKYGWGYKSWLIEKKEEIDNAFNNTYHEVYVLVQAIKTVPQMLLPFMEKHYQEKRAEHKAEGKNQHKSYAYINMPAMMQRLEATFLRRISQRMIDAGIAPFVTIHDSWILLEGDVDKAEQIVKEFFTELGFQPPQLKREACNKISNQ